MPLAKDETLINIKKDTKKLLKDYCKKIGVSYDSVIFKWLNKSKMGEYDEY